MFVRETSNWDVLFLPFMEIFTYNYLFLALSHIENWRAKRAEVTFDEFGEHKVVSKLSKYEYEQ